MSEAEIIHDAEVIGAELEPVTHGNLFRTEDPVEIIRRASETAQALSDVLRKQKLTTNIQGREHVRVEGWTLLGTMLGVFPVCEWTRPLDGQSGWEARVVARTLAGQEVGAAEAQCSRSESTWKNRDDYALRSMAQTRATSKALRQPLGFVVSLAGFDPTPAEEMPRDGGVTERVIEGPKSLTPPNSWAKLTELVSSYDQQVYEWFEAFSAAASRYLFEGKEPKQLKAKAEKDVLFQTCAGAALHLREQFEPDEIPPPTVDDVRGAFAMVLDADLAIPEEQLDEEAAEAAGADQ